ncbi:hypothetical protein Bpfe_010877 [Biomphalaria pfeifferi]|uniref:Uncharacterized protein n=1 Tax=Biomphalaria pfeifferi TaxID=112525 RepID=A0AAD8BTW7_BIOPF|nr:hypothetical protein Bpfe_010877 [Biomphalaria pfeifferi]
MNFICNLAACESETFLRGVCREGLMKPRPKKKTVLDTISLCVERPRHRLNNNLVNWRKRKWRPNKSVRMASWGTRFMPSVIPNDRPPPELSNIYYTVSFRDEKC